MNNEPKISPENGSTQRHVTRKGVSKTVLKMLGANHISGIQSMHDGCLQKREDIRGAVKWGAKIAFKVLSLSSAACEKDTTQV